MPQEEQQRKRRQWLRREVQEAEALERTAAKLAEQVAGIAIPVVTTTESKPLDFHNPL
jgi:hypothetical protein